MVTNMNWLIESEHLYHRWLKICSYLSITIYWNDMTGATSSYPYREPEFTHYAWLVIVLLFISLFNIYEIFVYVFFLVNILLSFSLINWFLILSCLNMVRVMVFIISLFNIYEMFVYVFFLVNILLSFSLINWLLILSCLNMVRVTTFNNIPVTS